MKSLKKITVFMTAGLMFCSQLCISSEAVSEKTVKIMSIGDSITDGYGTDGSYRKFLYNKLTEEGFEIDMTGPNWSWGDAEYSDEETGETFSYDAAHCGYSGYAIEEYSGRNGIRETVTSGNYLSEYNPDIVILQIGTNDVIDNHDIDSAGQRLDTLVTYILENISEDDALFVTTIPDLEPNRPDVYAWFSNYRHSADWAEQYSDEEAEQAVKMQISNYNTQVKKLVESKQKNGVSNIYFGDINSVVTDPAVQLKDGVHPNNTGYKLMGEYWAEKISAYLKGEIPDQSGHDSEKIIGDVNTDGSVTAADLMFLQKYFLNQYNLKGNETECADMNSDGIINISDFVLLKNLLV